MKWDSILIRQGFEKLARIYTLGLEVWWHAEHNIEIHVLDLGPCVLLRGTKCYFLRALSEEGEIFVRDLESMVSWLDAHFPSFWMCLGHIRNISRSLAITRIRQKRFRETGADFVPEEEEARLAEVKAEFEQKREDLHDRQSLKRLDAMSSLKSPTVAALLRDEEARLKTEAALLAEEGKRRERNLGIGKALVEQYQMDASAVCVAFMISTEGNWASSETEFQDALVADIKKLRNAHHFEVRQKLSQGSLHIPIEESADPAMDWLGLWAGGYPSPTHLEKWGQSVEEFRKSIESRFMVTPVRDIVVGGAVKDQRKRVTARGIRSFLERLPRSQKQSSAEPDLLAEGGWLGFVMDGSEVTDKPYFYPLNLRNAYVSGTTRAGKSFTARVIVENAITSGAKVIVFDPTRQWCGLTHPTTNEDVLVRLDDLGVGRERATGFDVRVFIPGTSLALPKDLREVFATSSVICSKDLDDAEQNRVLRDLLLTGYRLVTTESERQLYVIVIEEAHKSLPGNVVKEAEGTAKEVSVQINRVAREKVKYGLSLLLVTQSLVDFRGGTRIVREMCNSRFFMRATDRAELELVERYVSREAARTVKSLRPGEALVHGSMMPTAKVFVRPPFSEVRELSDHEIFSGTSSTAGRRFQRQAKLTEQESAALDVVEEHYRRTGKPIAAREFGNKMGVQGGSRHRLITSLTAKGFVQTLDMARKGRGRPPLGLIPAGDLVPNGGVKAE